MTSLNIINARIPGYSELQQILINEQGRIEAISSEGKVVHSKANFDILDVAGDWISLGGVDLQINGGLGLAFPNLDREHFPVLEKICQFLWEEGIDGFLPTIVTTSVEKIQRSLATLDEFRNSENTAQVTGVHLEGPFLHPEKRGAHPEKHLLPLTLDNVKRVLGDYAEIVKIITLAPELDTSGEVIP
ncbi:MAG: N-acetylglucosamine-6-phosphate deacetylase, partial [Chroococcales cyanobacterium]